MINVGGYHDKCGGISWVPWGDIMSTVGGYLEYRGGYHDADGGISWVLWGVILSTMGDIMMQMGGYHDADGGISWCRWGDIMSTVGGVQHGTEHPPPYCIHIIQGENLTKSKWDCQVFSIFKKLFIFIKLKVLDDTLSMVLLDKQLAKHIWILIRWDPASLMGDNRPSIWQLSWRTLIKIICDLPLWNLYLSNID